MKNLWTRYNALAIWARIVIALVAIGIVIAIGFRLKDALNVLIFGNTEAKQERANTVVAKEQTHAEANIADKAIQSVHERDVYREQITQVVHDSQEKVNAADHGQQMDPAIDAATAAGLCSVHDSLCRRPPGPAPLQPVR